MGQVPAEDLPHQTHRSPYQASAARSFAQHETRPVPLVLGTLLGRIEIPRIGVDAMVIDGTTDEYLRRAVGHIPGTVLPGQPGNAGLAGHRDTFFRGPGRIRKGDAIDLETLDGTFRVGDEEASRT